jgi:hypothetical protein
MTQLSLAIMALQPDSVFAKQYQAGLYLPCLPYDSQRRLSR